jgi:hypothetical protein
VLKGIAVPTQGFDLPGMRPVGAGEPAIGPASISSPLVGRDWDLAILSASVEALRDDGGGVRVLRGEPGVGKSRLVAEARRRSGCERVLWLEGRAVSFGRHLSYWPFIEILKQRFGVGSGDPEGEAWRKLEQSARELFAERAPEIGPYLATVLSLELTGEYEQRVKFLDAQALGSQVFLSMRELFEQLARRRPMLLVLEDWHWVDPNHDYFADGITEDLTTDLSRLAGSLVVSRNTAFTFEGRVADARQIGRELGVRYVPRGQRAPDGP